MLSAGVGGTCDGFYVVHPLACPSVSVGDTVGNSVGGYVGDSVGASVGNSVGAFRPPAFQEHANLWIEVSGDQTE